MIIFYLILLENIAGGDVLTGPYQVKQCAGRNIQITCRYHSFYRNNVKYWCKGYYFNHCSILIRTNQPLHVSGPLEITDNKNEGFFSIHMKSIKSENSGWYWCAIERVSRHVSFAVELIISKEGTQQCLVPEPTPQLKVRDTTTLPVTTRTLTTSKTTETTSMSQATLKRTVIAKVTPQTMTGEINFTQTPVHKIWSIIRWFIFLGLCLIVFCFTMYTELS
uniref:CMRF35-like molecule 3 n=1 Tax=Electrophorus electricus TaxID=8005 RepID=UPI0015D094DF|nr:CMRF35-like molecule 3 [Electrophorus electricus]